MKNKAFTLVELLAVIIILGLLALLIIPRVQNTLKNSKKNIYESSAYSLLKEAESYFLEEKASSKDFTACTYDFTNDSGTCEGFEFKGKKPEEGTLKIDENGNTQFVVKFENNCYTKRMYSGTISVIKNCGKNINLIPEIVTSGDGLYESELEPGRLIYRGGNPNNYIWLDENNDKDKTTDELYRIISYETDGTIKVVRKTSIGEIAWDSRTNQTSGPRKNQDNTYCDYEETNENLNSSPGQTYFGCNVWGNQQNTLYNNTSFSNKDFTYKYYQNDESTIMTNSDFSGTITKNSSLNEYLNNSTDNNTYWPKITTLNKYITKHSFHVGGLYYAEYSTSKQLTKEKEEERLYTWAGKIALMNITEYVEASINPTCTNVYSNFFYNANYYKDTNNDGEKEQTITSYDDWPCSNRTYNWMANSSTEWFLTPYSKYQYTAWGVNSQGYFVHFNYVSAPHNIRPVFYLNSDIALAGTGTEGDPYYIID